MKYLFPNHKVELTDPTIESVASSFAIGDEFVSVTAVLSANGAKLFWVDLGQMPNTESWGDDELQAFALTALEQFKI